MNSITSAPTACTANFTTARSVSMRLFSAVMPVNMPINHAARQIHQEQHQQDPEHRLDHVVQGRPLAALDQSDPIRIDVAQSSCSSCRRRPRSARFF